MSAAICAPAAGRDGRLFSCIEMPARAAKVAIAASAFNSVSQREVAIAGQLQHAVFEGMHHVMKNRGNAIGVAQYPS